MNLTRKITYWVCNCETDSSAYNIRAKTKTEASRMRGERIKQGASEFAWGAPRKVTIAYRDIFDLVDHCLSEARGGE